MAIRLLSRDGQHFAMDTKAANQSATIRNMMEEIDVGGGEGDGGELIPVPNVNGAVLAKVVEYCAFLANADGNEEAIACFDAEFIKVDTATLLELVVAANYLDIKPLLHLTCATVAGMLKGKTVEQMRHIFNIANDFTPEEEEAVRREHQWAFES